MNEPLTSVFGLVLDASWQGAAAIALILAIRPLLGARIPAHWRSMLWLLVIVRLLVPTFVLPRTPANVPKLPALTERLEAMPGLASRQDEAPPPPVFSSPSDRVVSPRPEPAPRFVISWPAILRGCAVVWALGFAALAGTGVFAALRFRLRVLRRASPAPAELRGQWEACCARLRLCRPLPVLASADIESPALVGAWRPRLLVPEKRSKDLTAADWEHVFLHELAHYRRGDHWTNLLHLAALCVHWFNPVVWIGMRFLRADRELAADEWALRRFAPNRPFPTRTRCCACSPRPLRFPACPAASAFSRTAAR